MFVGTWLSGVIGESAAITNTDGSVVHDWSRIWLIPAMMSGAVLVVFALLFNDEIQETANAATDGLDGVPVPRS
jgi:hypothetical protein